MSTTIRLLSGTVELPPQNKYYLMAFINAILVVFTVYLRVPWNTQYTTFLTEP